jgi:hypothetical protein
MKYKNERRIQQALQGQIMELKARLQSNEKPETPVGHRDEHVMGTKC